MTAHDGDAVLHRRLADVARLLHARGARGPGPAGIGGDAEALAKQMVTLAVAEVRQARYAGITLATSPSEVSTPAATHPYPALLDVIQRRHQQGPCLSAAEHDHTVRVDDLAADRRWPLYRRDAIKATPIRSVLSFRLFTFDDTIGALNLYADAPHAFDAHAEDLGYALATHTALAWDTARRDGQFRSALASRDVIGQAKGILMSRFDIDAVAAFDLLRRTSQATNTTVAAIAARLAASPRIDDTSAPAAGGDRA